MKGKRYLLASDFDQTLSFNDSGAVLSELIGRPGFRERVAGLARTNLIQQGGELAYLLRHDPESERSSSSTPRARYAASSACPRATARWRCSTSCSGGSWSAPTASCTWATAARTST